MWGRVLLEVGEGHPLLQVGAGESKGAYLVQALPQHVVGPQEQGVGVLALFRKIESHPSLKRTRSVPGGATSSSHTSSSQPRYACETVAADERPNSSSHRASEGMYQVTRYKFQTEINFPRTSKTAENVADFRIMYRPRCFPQLHSRSMMLDVTPSQFTREQV